MTLDRLPAPLRALLGRQQHLMTRQQARDGGLTESAIRWGLERSWHSVLPGVIHVLRNALTRDQKIIAALLYAGEHAVAHGATAATWYGLGCADDHGIVRVLVPRNYATRQCRWVRVRRSSVPFDHHVDGPRRFVNVQRAVVEAARDAAGPEDAEAVVIEAVQRRLATLEGLASLNDRLGRRGSSLATRALAAAAVGTWSVPEAGLYRLCASSRVLPEMWCNPDLFGIDDRRLITPDGWLDDVGLALMVHSRRWHDGQRWATTVERDGDLVSQGVRVLPIAPTSVAREPRRVLAVVETTYRSARAMGGRANVRAVRRSVR